MPLRCYEPATMELPVGQAHERELGCVRSIPPPHRGSGRAREFRRGRGRRKGCAPSSGGAEAARRAPAHARVGRGVRGPSLGVPRLATQGPPRGRERRRVWRRRARRRIGARRRGRRQRQRAACAQAAGQACVKCSAFHRPRRSVWALVGRGRIRAGACAHRSACVARRRGRAGCGVVACSRCAGAVHREKREQAAMRKAVGVWGAPRTPTLYYTTYTTCTSVPQVIIRAPQL